MSLCVGIDLSTRRVDLAAIPLDPEIEGGPKTYTMHDPLLRGIGLRIPLAIRILEQELDADVVTLAVEKPAGKFVHPSIHELHGAIIPSVPLGIQVTSLYPVEWRQALGLTGKNKNNKAAGLARVQELYPMCTEWDEHQLDALGIAHAWRTIQWETTAA